MTETTPRSIADRIDPAHLEIIQDLEERLRLIESGAWFGSDGTSHADVCEAVYDVGAKLARILADRGARCDTRQGSGA